MANKIRVYGKAQNRTSLGIIHAYMTMFPQATLADLRKAFPNSLNPDKGTEENFIPANEKGTTANWDGYFKNEDELLTMGDGQKVSVVKMWTKPSFERLISQAKLYDIEIAQFDPAEKGFGKKGSFYLEMLNGYTPPAREEKKSNKWLIPVIIGALLLLGGLLWWLLGSGNKPEVVEKIVEKVVEKEVVVHDTIYMEQIEEIERNFNAALFVQGKSELNDDAKLALHDLAKVLKKNPELKLSIEGHTSKEGSEDHNQKLSEARAQAAVDFLVNKEGIAAERLQAKGFGSSKPISDESLDVNRRTEFVILDN